MYKSWICILFSCTLMCSASAQRATDTFKLYFDLNVPVLNEKMEKKIDLLIYNDKIISGSGVTIVGYADFLGSEQYNKDLSMKRAENVRDYLVKYGINQNDIKLCIGRGKVDREGMSDKSGYPIDRRVDIVMNNKTRKKVPAEKVKPEKTPRKDTIVKVSITSIDEMKTLKAGSVFQLKNVYFPADRHVMKPESNVTLEQLYVVLRDHPRMKISIEGHVCCIHDAPDALDIDTHEPILSINRARAIYQYLVEKGIEAARLSYKGFGRSRPVVVNELTEEDAEKNRRVEIRVVENR
jgi:outer membrane protein OmpA-like peptidoglycan-associated protein